MPRSRALMCKTLLPSIRTSPASGKSRPDMMRRSVVLPEPEGPSSAKSSPCATDRPTDFRATKSSKRLVRSIASMLMNGPVAATGELPFEQALRSKSEQRQHGKKRCDREGGGEVVLIVQNFDMQRHGVGMTADMPGYHGNRPEFAHGAGIAQQHAVKQAPADVGKSDAEKGLKRRGAEREGGFLILGALLLHKRNELAGYEGKSDEHRRQNNARNGKDDLDIMLLEPWAQPALQSEKKHIDEARDHRRDREGNVDQGDQQAPAVETEFGDDPGGHDAEDHVDRHCNGGGEQGQSDGGEGYRIGDGPAVGAPALGESLDEHGDQRQADKQGEEKKGCADQRHAHGEGIATNGPQRHASALRNRQRDQACMELMPKRIRSETKSITTAMAVACSYSNSSSFTTMSKGAISETIGRLPAMKMTEPYSPTARAKASAKPVVSAGKAVGRITLRKVW